MSIDLCSKCDKRVDTDYDCCAYEFGDCLCGSCRDEMPMCDTGEPCKAPYCWVCPLGETPLTTDLDPEIHSRD
jgi:hypothetical protein